MSQTIPSGGYGMVSRLVMRMPGVSKEAKAVYALLCSYTGDKDYCFPTVETLAADLETSVRQIIRLTEELKEKGLVEKRKLANNKRKTTYVPLVPESITGVTDVTNKKTHDTEVTIGAPNHDTGDIITGDMDVTLILTGNTNNQENTNRDTARDEIIEHLAEPFRLYNQHVRPADIVFLDYRIRSAVINTDLKTVRDAILQVVGEATSDPKRDKRYLPHMSNLLADPEKLRSRAADYKPRDPPETWHIGKSDDYIVRLLAKRISEGGTIREEHRPWETRARQHLSESQRAS